MIVNICITLIVLLLLVFCHRHVLVINIFIYVCLRMQYSSTNFLYFPATIFSTLFTLICCAWNVCINDNKRGSVILPNWFSLFSSLKWLLYAYKDLLIFIGCTWIVYKNANKKKEYVILRHQKMFFYFPFLYAFRTYI